MVRIVNRKKPAVHFTVFCVIKNSSTTFLERTFESYEWAALWAEKCMEKYPNDFVGISLNVDDGKEEEFSTCVFSSDIDN